MIQDGFSRYGALPDDLSFHAPGSTDPATLDAGLPPILFSDSRGAFDGAVIFHTFSTLNPGDLVQVLSGTSPGGLEMSLGFEDLPSDDRRQRLPGPGHFHQDQRRRIVLSVAGAFFLASW